MSKTKTPLLGRVLDAKTTQTAFSALLCSTLAQHLTPTFHIDGGQQESEVLSEAICWAVLPLLFGYTSTSSSKTKHLPRYQQQHHQQTAQGASSLWSPGLALWVVALGVALTCWFRAEVGFLGLFPLITPLLLLLERKLHSGNSGSVKAAPGGAPYYPSNTLLTVSLTTLLFATLAMLDGNIIETALSAIPTLALLIVYVAFVISSGPTRGSSAAALKFPPSFGALGDLEDVLAGGKLSVRIVVLLGMILFHQIWSFGYPAGISFAAVLFSGLARAGSWYFTICTIKGTSVEDGDLEKNREHDHRLVQPRLGTSWTLATLIGTFCLVSSRDPSIQSSNFQALSQVVASLVVLGQIIHTLPRQAKAKSILWVFALVSVVPYLYHNFALRQLNSTAPSWSPSRPHPADSLVQRATADFDKLLERQSKTYDAAVREYKRRYGIDPPPGFDKWYELAVAHDSPIIDEFDTIFENISPFLKLSGQEITKIINKVRKMPNVELWDCTFTSTDDKAMTQCVHFSRSFDRHISTMFDQMLTDLKGLKLPDVRFLVNHFDEPRVMFPPQPEDPRVALETIDLSHQPTWDYLTRLCHETKTYHSSSPQPKYPDVNTYSLPLVTDRRAELDICQHPSYRPLNGLFVSPTSFKLISGLVPVLSTGAPSTMGDILIPSPAYSEPSFQYHASADIPWSKKYSNLYWAGSTTGGFATDQVSWPLFQRQRFVSKTQNLNRSHHHTYLSQLPGSGDGEIITTSTSRTLDPAQYDTSFTRIFQCLARECRSQRFFFRLKSWADSNAPLQSKLTFDLDGNGISGRYYKLLASNSLPLKQTVLREWHDERLWAWAHYVPVSQGLGELPELVRWFLGSKRGGEVAEVVARRGKDWMGRGMRSVDRSLYLYRVLLELGRVQDGEREAWDLHLHPRAVRDG